MSMPILNEVVAMTRCSLLLSFEKKDITMVFILFVEARVYMEMRRCFSKLGHPPTGDVIHFPK